MRTVPRARLAAFKRARAWRGAGVMALMLALAAPVQARGPGEVPVGGTLPDALLQGLNGASRHLSDYRGRPLLINVWASWCGPCMEEMASLERLAWREGRAPFAMIGISTDDYPERARAVLGRTNATITHYVDHDLQMETMLGASTIPLTVLVDANGRVVDKVYGAQEWDAPDALQRIQRAFRPTARSRSGADAR
jgi:thiol-disulfide isomerase/thioredoxin